MAEDGDKTEAPTARRLMEARQQGNIARSHDLTSAVLLIGGLYLMKWFGERIIVALREVIEVMLSGPSLSDLGTSKIGEQTLQCFSTVANAVWPLMVGAALFVIVANIAQVGINFSP